jgi:hypothetical protein
MVIAAATPMQASINLVPLLFLAYVAYAIITAIAKASRAAQAQRTAQQAPAQSIQPSVDQVRAALAQRAQRLATAQAAARAASRAAAVQTQAAPPPPPASLTPTLRAPTPDATAAAAWDMSVMPLMTDAYATIGAAPTSAPKAVDLASVLGLQPAALAIVARAVIGPCAARSGMGHNPEDW